MKKSKILREAIMQRRAVVVPGCYDALSAKVIEKRLLKKQDSKPFKFPGSGWQHPCLANQM